MPSPLTGGCLCGAIRYTIGTPVATLRAGTLDDSSGMKITGNIWTSAARPWDHIDPATECHPGNLPPPPAK